MSVLKFLRNPVNRSLVIRMSGSLANFNSPIISLVNFELSLSKELWHGNIIPQEDSRMNSKERKALLGYMARHHEDLEKSFSDEQKEIFENYM